MSTKKERTKLFILYQKYAKLIKSNEKIRLKYFKVSLFNKKKGNQNAYFFAELITLRDPSQSRSAGKELSIIS